MEHFAWPVKCRNMHPKAKSSAAAFAVCAAIVGIVSCGTDVPEPNVVDGTTRINTTYSPKDGPYEPRHGGRSNKPYTPDPSVFTPEQIYLYWLDEKEIVYFNDDEVILIGRTYCDTAVTAPSVTADAAAFADNLSATQKADLVQLSRTYLCH